MFTGLIEGTGKVRFLQANSGQGGVLHIGALPWQELLSPGESVAVNGACLTVVSSDSETFIADLSPETLQRTTLSHLNPGERVNLERSLRLGDRLGGHLVLGHVDGQGEIRSFTRQGSFWTLEVSLPSSLARYVVEKGSIAVDGISLTIASLKESHFTVAVIPTTWEVTNLSDRKVGDPVNLEADLIAKHLERLLHPYAHETRITTDLLAEHGFL